MKNKCLVLLTSSVFILSSCFNGVKKVSFSEFHEKAVEAQQKERPEAKKIVINGEIESEDKKYTAKNLQITEDTDTATLSICVGTSTSRSTESLKILVVLVLLFSFVFFLELHPVNDVITKTSTSAKIICVLKLRFI